MNINFPIGTKKAAAIIGCSESAVKKHCVGRVVRLDDGSGPYLIYESDLEYLKGSIRKTAGKPPTKSKK